MQQPRFLSSLLVILALTAPVIGHAQHRGGNLSEPQLQTAAEAAFQLGIKLTGNPKESRKSFAMAAEYYDELRRRGIRNPDLFRNLGNAELMAGNLGGAIFAYRQGLIIAPNDRTLLENLDYARSRVQHPPGSGPPESTWPGWLPRFSLPLIVIVFAVLYISACLAWTRRLIARRGTGLALGLLTSALVAGIGFAILEWQSMQAEKYPLAVISSDEVAMHRGNGDSYPKHAELPILNEGMEAIRLFERAGWLQLQFPGGPIGWVRKDAVLVDETPQ